MIGKILSPLLFIFLFTGANDINYKKEFYDSGKLKSEGWMAGDLKTRYWYFYHNNGSIKSQGDYKNDLKDGYWYFYNEEGLLIKEGHYKKDEAVYWWIFYKDEEVSRKVQYTDGMKNGLALIYKNGKPVKAERYENDKFIGSWTSVSSFKRDNPNLSF